MATRQIPLLFKSLSLRWRRFFGHRLVFDCSVQVRLLSANAESASLGLFDNGFLVHPEPFFLHVECAPGVYEFEGNLGKR